MSESYAGRALTSAPATALPAFVAQLEQAAPWRAVSPAP
jgi:hypothetical protein